MSIRSFSSIAVLFFFLPLLGCVSAQASRIDEFDVRLTPDGRIYVGDTYTGLAKLAAQLKANGVKRETQITIQIPHNTSPDAISSIGRELASSGYRRFVFSKPRRAVVEKGADPLLISPSP